MSRVRLPRLALILSGCVLLSVLPAPAAGQPPLVASKKIDILVLDKIRELTTAEIDETNAGRLNAATRFSTPLLKIDDRARIQLYVDLLNTLPSTLAQLVDMGQVDLEVVNRTLKTVQAWVPYRKVEALAALNVVVRIRRPEYAVRWNSTEGGHFRQ